MRILYLYFQNCVCMILIIHTHMHLHTFVQREFILQIIDQIACNICTALMYLCVYRGVSQALVNFQPILYTH